MLKIFGNFCNESLGANKRSSRHSLAIFSFPKIYVATENRTKTSRIHSRKKPWHALETCNEMLMEFIWKSYINEYVRLTPVRYSLLSKWKRKLEPINSVLHSSTMFPKWRDMSDYLILNSRMVWTYLLKINPSKLVYLVSI